MDRLGDYHHKQSQSERDKQHMVSLTCGILTNDINGTSQVGQQVGICLPVQGTQIQSLVLEDPHATEQLSPGPRLLSLRALGPWPTTAEPARSGALAQDC